MNYRVLGRTGLRVSMLGFGGAPLGSAYGPTTQAESTAAVQRGPRRRHQLFRHVALLWRDHGRDRAGPRIGGHPRDAYILATKVGRYGLDRL